MTFNQLITQGAGVTDVLFLLQSSFLPRGDLFCRSPGSNTLSETFDAIAKSGLKQTLTTGTDSFLSFSFSFFYLPATLTLKRRFGRDFTFILS